MSSITDMTGMFTYVSSLMATFRIGTCPAVHMTDMFSVAPSFNDDISKWDVSSVTDMADMFSCAPSLVVTFRKWDVSNVTDMAAYAP